jgi:hypothetical protein
LVQLKSSFSGDTYAAFRKVVGVAYYLHRAKEIGRFSRDNTLYRLVHLRVASHAVAQRTCYFARCGTEDMWKGGVHGGRDGGVFLVWVPVVGMLAGGFYTADERIRGASGKGG